MKIVSFIKREAIQSISESLVIVVLKNSVCKEEDVNYAIAFTKIQRIIIVMFVVIKSKRKKKKKRDEKCIVIVVEKRRKSHTVFVGLVILIIPCGINYLTAKAGPHLENRVIVP